MPLIAHGPDLWTLDHPFKVGGLDMGLRTTLVRLANDRLWMHSPGPLDDEAVAAIGRLGEVAAVVAPNTMHNLFIDPALRAFPGARLFASPGLMARKKRFAGAERLTEVPPPLWNGVLDQHAVAGMPRVQEVVFFHRASRTLILTDFCFNVVRSPSRFTRIGMRINGAYGKFGPSRLARALMKDKRAVKSSVEHILEWDFERIFVTHGDVVPAHGKEALRAAFAFL